MAQNLFGTATPAIPDASDGTPYNLGTRFVPAVDGVITHGRWRFPATVQTGVVISVYRFSDVTTLGSATFVGPTPGVWNEVAFSSTISVTAGVTYMVAVWIPSHYTATPSYPWPVVSGDLTAPATNGYYLAIGTPVMPTTQSGNAASYFVDVVFEPNAGSVTGSGALTLPALTISGTGVASSAGFGALILPAMTAAGSGTASAAGTGDLILPTLATSGAGTASATGSGALTLPAIRVVGSGGPPAPETSSPNWTLTSTSSARPLITISRDAPLTTR